MKKSLLKAKHMVTRIFHSQNQSYLQLTGENLSPSPNPKYLGNSHQLGIRKPTWLDLLLTESTSHSICHVTKAGKYYWARTG